MQTVSTFPRVFAPGDTPSAVAILYTDEQDLTGAQAVADLFRLEVEEAAAVDLDAVATEDGPEALRLVCEIPAEVTAELAPGVFFLRFRVSFDSGAVLTIPADDRLRLRVA